MTMSTISDMAIQNAQYRSGMAEGINRVIDGFNGSSRNCLRLVSNMLAGTSASTSFWDRPSSVIAHRDPTSTSDVDDIALTQDSFVSVKVNKRWGPFAYTLDSLKKIGATKEEISFMLGVMYGEETAKNMIDTAILSVEAALEAQTALNYDAGALTLTPTILSKGLRLFGDQASRIGCWLMYSDSYNDLVEGAISAKIYEEAGLVVYGGAPGTLNRPALVIDSAALYESNASGSADDRHIVLGLTADAATITQSEPPTMLGQEILGQANLAYRIQGEYAYNVELKGMAWDIANGGTNPNDASLGTGAYWLKKVANDKSLAGIRIEAA